MKYDYDILVIGMGPGGMAVSAMGAAMGLKVCAVEKRAIGGECMNCGCIPSKALLQMGRFRHQVGQLGKMRLAETALPAVGDVFGKIQADITYINDKKTMKMFDKVELVLGEGAAAFVDDHTVAVGERRISAKRIFIATGTQPWLLPVEGLETIDDLLTNENLFTLERVPESLLVLGGGAIACEMAQAFSRLGARVTMVQRSERVMSRGDGEAADLLAMRLRDEGIELITGDTVKKIGKVDGGVAAVTDKGKEVMAERVLAAWGRTCDYRGLQLEKAGIAYDSDGIKVDKYLRTTRKNIFAVGDCNGYQLFSHAAMHQGMIALMNSMLPGPMRRDYRKYAVPYTVFTEPAVSAVGMTEQQLEAKGVTYETTQVRYEDYGAAIAEEVTDGFVKVFHSKAGRIYGVVIVGEGSGEMINEWALAVQKKLRLSDIMMLQHSFPTMGFLSKRIGETWMMKRMEWGFLKKMCRFMFGT